MGFSRHAPIDLRFGSCRCARIYIISAGILWLSGTNKSNYVNRNYSPMHVDCTKNAEAFLT